MAYQLDFVLNAANPAPLRDISAAVEAIAQRTKLSSGELRIFDSAMQASLKSGISLKQALLDLSAPTATLGKGINNLAKELLGFVDSGKKVEAQASNTERALMRLFTVMGTRTAGLPFGSNAAIGSLGSGLLGPLAVGAIAGIASIAKMASGVAETAREMTNLSQRTGLSIQETQLWVRSAEVAGVNANSLTTAMRTLSRGLAEGGEEGKKQREILDQLGVKYQDSLGRLIPFGQIIDQVASKLGSMAAGPARDLAANTLLGRGGLELIPLMARLKELGVIVSNTGVVMSDKGVRGADIYAEALTVLGLRWDALKQKMALPIHGLISNVLTGNLTGPINPDNAGQVNATFRAQTISPEALRAASLRGTATPVDADVAQGNTLYHQFLGRRGTDKRDLQADLEDARRRLAGLPPPIEGLSDKDQTKRISDITAGEKKVANLQAQIDAIQKLKEQEQDLFAFEESMRQKAVDPITQIFQTRDELIRKQGLTGGAADRADVAALNAAQQKIDKERPANDQLLLKLNTRGSRDDKFYEQQTDPALKALAQTTADWDRYAAQLRKLFAAEEKVRVIALGEQKASITGSSRLSQIKFLQGGGTSTPGGDLQNRLQLAQSLYDAEITSANKIYDIEKRTDEIEKAKAELRKASTDAVLENEQKILDITNQQRASLESLATGAFGAFLGGKSRGLDLFIKSKVEGIATSFVGNAAGTLYDQIGGGQLQVPGQGTAANPNFLGKLLHGTPFGIDPLKAAQSTSTNQLSTVLGLNVSSTDKLTLSLDKLTNAIEYEVTGGTAGSLPGGVSAAANPLPLGLPGSAQFLNLQPLSTTSSSSSGLPVSIVGATGTGLTALSAASSAISSTSSPEALASATLKGLSALNKSSSVLGFPDFSISTGSGSAVAASALVAPTLEAGAGVLGLVSGLGQGGPKGALTAAGGASAVVAGVASGLKAMGDLSAALSAVPIVGSILGTALPLIGSLFGSNPQIRQRAITNTLENQQYYAPVALNTNQSTGGSLTSYSSTGQIRTSLGASPFPAGVQEPYYLYPTHPIIGVGTPGVNVPGTGGTLGSPVGTSVGNLNPGGDTSKAAATPVIVQHNYNISAIDQGGVATFFSENHQHIADATVKALHSGGNGLLETMRSQISGH